jgi:hypothetical protein
VTRPCEHRDWSGPCREPAEWCVPVRSAFGSEESFYCCDHLGHRLVDVRAPGQWEFSAWLVVEDEEL